MYKICKIYWYFINNVYNKTQYKFFWLPMHVFIKPPPGYTPHQLHWFEHIITCPTNYENYSTFVFSSEHTTHYDYVSLFFGQTLSPHKILDFLTIVRPENLIEKEKKAIKEELLSLSYDQKIQQKIRKKLSLPENIQDFSYDALISLQKTLLSAAQILITDKNFKILHFIPWNTTPLSIPSQNYQYSFIIDGYKNKVFGENFSNWKIYYKHFCIQEFINSQIEYEHRFLQWVYDFPYWCYQHRIENINFLTLSGDIRISPKSEYFEAHKKRFLSEVKNGYARKWYIITKMYFWHAPTFKEIESYIVSLDIKDIPQIFSKK